MAISFSNIRIMPRVLCALLVPSLGLLLASSVVVTEKAATVVEMQKLTSLADLATHVSGLVHEMQKERGASAVFLGSKGEELKRELPEQRLVTDSQRQALAAALKGFDARTGGAQLASIIEDATGKLAKLDTLRQSVGSLGISAADSNIYFTTTIGRLLDVELEISQIVTNVSVARALSAYSSFMQAKERSGQERATGAPGFAAGKFSLAQYRLFAGVGAAQNTYFALFNSYATGDDKAFLAATVVGEPVTEVDRMRKMALETAPGEPLRDAGGVHWFQVATARINLMKKVEDHLAANLVALAETTRAAAGSAFWFALGIAAGLVCLTIILGFVIVRSISRPITGMTDAMHRLSGGDLSTEVPARERGDEVGVMAKAVQVFKESMIEAERMRAERIDRARTAEKEKSAALREMAENVERETNAAVGDVAGYIERMASNARQMSDSAATVGADSGSVAAAAEQALANAQTLTEAASQLSASITGITGQVNSSRKMTMEAVSASEKAQATIEKLSEAAGKVGAVTSLISEIASQTNLLALNATIEAARAGEAGRGFAVVASEVKSLAEQTAKATSEIAQQIGEIQQATAESVTSIGAIGDVIRNVDQFSTQIASAMQRQNSVTQEISRTVGESSQAAREVATQIVSVSSEAAETGRRAAEIRDGSAEIAGKVDGLRATLVRVVRTSTADVDRRVSSRVEIDCQATLAAGGRSRRVTVRNLATGGAMIAEALPDLAANTSVVLTIDGVKQGLEGIVDRNDADGAVIKFRVTDATEKLVADLIQSRRAA